jgi:ParB family chromosome partitioning protein
MCRPPARATPPQINTQERAVQLSYEIVTAPADAIRDGGSHLFWASDPSPALTGSIRELGQAQPLLVHETGDGLSLIAGHARLAALRALGQPAMARLVIAPDPKDLGILYLTDNALRPLDDAMRLAALRYFAPLMDAPSLAAHILPRLGVRPGSKDAKLLLAWLDMPAAWQAHLAAGRVPLAAGGPLAAMDEADRAAVEPLFAEHSWSRSNAVNMLTWLFETARMTGSPLAEIMDRSGMTDVPVQQLSPKDAMARLAASAKSARYPSLSALEARFDAAARELAAGTRWRVSQPDNFETGGVELSVRIADPEQLGRALRELAAMADRPQWATLWTTDASND